MRKIAVQKPDLIKIWYIIDEEHPVEKFRPPVRAAIEESHAHKIRVAVTRLNSKQRERRWKKG